MLASVLAGCASTATNSVQTDQNDPYEATNRNVFALNQNFDKHLTKPIAEFYNKAVPEPAREGIHNFLTNLNQPVTFGNDVLQGEPKRAVDTFGRFVVNSTIGIGGLVDAAGKFGMEEHTSDFGETLAVYGVGEGPYLVLPGLGPSNPRDAFGNAVDILMDPITWVTWRSSEFFKLSRGLAGINDERAANVETLDQLEKSSVDLYATIRSLYRQHRQAEINHGKPDIENLPNF